MAHFRELHDWSMTPREAVELQKSLRDRVIQTPLDRPVRTIAGADISFNKFSSTIYAGVVVIALDTMETIAEAGVVTETRFPYVPGLLSFRESPALIEAWSKLTVEPDAMMIDGHGYAHPRRFGIACHIGLMIERPTVACGKSILVGTFEEPPPERGGHSPLVDKGEVIGAALRTKNRVNPVYVNVGHLIDLPGAIELALRCDGGYRIPEPTRRAHLLVNRMRTGK